MSAPLNIEAMPNPGPGAGDLASLAGVATTGLSVSWIGAAEWEEWDRFVEGHPEGMIYHLSGWMSFLEDVFPHIEGRALALRCRESGAIRAGIPVYLARSRILGNRLLCIPFGTLGGALTSSAEELEILAAELEVSREKWKCRKVELRGVRRFEKSLQGSLFAASSGYCHHYLELNRPLEALRAGFSTNVKRCISRACKAGIEVHEDRSGEALDRYGKLLDHSRRRLRLPIYPSRFVRAMLTHLPESSVSLLIARKGDSVIGGLVELQFGDWAIYEQVADSPAGRKDRVNHLLLWHSIERAVTAGRRYYSLGRTAVDNEGLLRFKRAWGTVEEPLWNLALPPEKNSSGRTGGEVLARRAVRWGMGTLPLPVARKMSRLFYRHWA